MINQQKESSKIKSGCFDEQNSFVYSTSTHIKYMFLEGKTSGTFRSIDQPVYVAFVSIPSPAFPFARIRVIALVRMTN